MLRLSLPAFYSLEITAACNCRCAGCSNVYSTERSTPPLPAAIWEEWIADWGPSAVEIRLTGGEPTLHPEFDRILKHVTSYGARILVFTNARWEDSEHVLRTLHGSGDVGLLVSVHGSTPYNHETFTGIPGAWNQTITNIQLAVEEGVTVALNCVITQQNWADIKEIAILGKQLGAQHVAFSRYIGRPLPDIEPTDEQLWSAIYAIETLLAQGESVAYGIGIPYCFRPNHSEGCLAGVAYMAVDPWGNVRPCAHSPTIAGSLFASPLEEIWQGETMSAWRSRVPIKCLRCPAYTDCHGGCRALQELRPSGDPLVGEPVQVFSPVQYSLEIPAERKPRLAARLRSEIFGYALLGRGHVIPVPPEARPLLEACNGDQTFRELVEEFGEGALDLLGELWERGMLETV